MDYKFVANTLVRKWINYITVCKLITSILNLLLLLGMVNVPMDSPHFFCTLYNHSSIAEIGLYLISDCSSQFYNAKDMHETNYNLETHRTCETLSKIKMKTKWLVGIQW